MNGIKRIVVVIGDTRHEAKLPSPDARCVEVKGARCPTKCGAGEPLRVAGVKGTRRQTHDHVIEAAACVECHATIGEIDVTMSTLFGIEEDAAVLVHGRARVYG